MSQLAPFDYTEDEIRSFLPSGWTILEATPGDVDRTWDPKKRLWTTRIEDTADMPWDLEIRERDVEKQGRIPALKAAMDRLYVDRLGRRTRGLGL